MLALRTTDAWDFTLLVDDGSAPPEAFVNTALDALSTVDALIYWLNFPARPWYGVNVFSASWLRYDYGGARLTLSCTAPFTLDGGAVYTLGLDADTYASAALAISPAAGTWDPAVPISVRGYARSVKEGDAESAGATRPGVPGTGHYLPRVTAICSAAEAAYLSEVLTTAADPRVAVIQQEHMGAALTLAIGEVSRTRQGTAFSVNFAVAGEVV